MNKKQIEMAIQSLKERLIKLYGHRLFKRILVFGIGSFNATL